MLSIEITCTYRLATLPSGTLFKLFVKPWVWLGIKLSEAEKYHRDKQKKLVYRKKTEVGNLAWN